jgi:hypothetical protein
MNEIPEVVHRDKSTKYSHTSVTGSKNEKPDYLNLE